MRPLPLVPRPVDDELLSSWINRTGAALGTDGRRLLKAAGIRTAPSSVDDNLSRPEMNIVAAMLRSTDSEIHKRTHNWLGRFSQDFTRHVSPPVECVRCRAVLQRERLKNVRLKQWTEAWRVRCGICGNLLTQKGIEEFNLETSLRDYASVEAAADRGAAILHRSILAFQPDRIPPWVIRKDVEISPAARILPLYVVLLFRPSEGRKVSRWRLGDLMFPTRFFLLAAVGARDLNEADGVYQLHRRWKEHRRHPGMARPARRWRGNSQSQN